MVEQDKPQQATDSMDYEGFMTVLKYLLDAAWGSDWGTFTPEGPNTNDPHDIQYPIITYIMDRMEPGKISKDGTREIKPRLRYIDRSRDVNGTQPPVTSIYGQVMEASISFEIWEETNAQADEMAKRFRALISTYAGYLKEKGLKEIIFVSQTPSAYSTDIQDAHKVRRLTYFVKIEELIEVPTDVFHVMDVVDKNLHKQQM